MPPYSWSPALGGQASGVWRAYAILAGEGCAGRFATGRGVARSRCARPLEPPRAQGARYALGAGAGTLGVRRLRSSEAERVSRQAAYDEGG